MTSALLCNADLIYKGRHFNVRSGENIEDESGDVQDCLDPECEGTMTSDIGYELEGGENEDDSDRWHHWEFQKGADEGTFNWSRK